MISAKKTFAFLVLLLDILALMTVAKEKLEATNKHIREGLERYSVVSIAKTVREVNKGLWAEYDLRGRPTICHGPRKCMDQSDETCRVRDYYKRCSDDSEEPKGCYTYEPRGFQWVMTRFYFLSDVPEALFGNGIGFYLIWG